MGNCRNCGTEITGEGLCPSCYSDYQDDKSWNWEIAALFSFAWNFIFKPLLPPAILLTAFQWAGIAILATTESKVLSAAIQYPGFLAAALLFGKLYKDNIHKGIWGSYWTKVYIYYTGLLIAVVGITTYNITQGAQKDPVQTMILSAFFLVLAGAQIAWMVIARKKVLASAMAYDDEEDYQ